MLPLIKLVKTTESGRRRRRSRRRRRRRRQDVPRTLTAPEANLGREQSSGGGTRAHPRASLLDPITLTGDEDVSSRKRTVGI